MKNGRSILWIIFVLIALTCVLLPANAENASADLVVLSTTDMHGKCWETNILTGGQVAQNMLRVSTAVREIRQAYGAENVILIDNGDLFQGTPVSEEHLLRSGHPGEEPEAMALCLKEIGYDVLSLGNHEFNYPWDIMRRVYEDLEKGGVRVLAANACYDGSDGVHEAGDSAFGTYIIREVMVNGHAHRIGILGLENNDITRWDLPVNYPGIMFVHPDNPTFDQAQEAARYIAQMLDDQCEMIIVAYHGGLGTADEPLVFGINSENQGQRIIKGTENIDLLILGHDHSTGYSNTFATDTAGRKVPIVNGGGQELTKTVFHLTEDQDGGLVCELVDTENVVLFNSQPDADLEEKIRPYAEEADAKMDLPVGTLTGTWDGVEDLFTRQSNAMDLVSAASMEIGTDRMREKFGDSGLEALRAASGLNHLDVDAVFSSMTNGGYIPRSGPVSTRDIYRLYRFANSLLILPMYGRDIQSVLEENAAERLTCRLLGGKAYFFTLNDQFTSIICGGMNFHYDMAKPAGERVTIDSFANGRPFDPDMIYLVAVNNYLLGNERCGLRYYSNDDALWSQLKDSRGGTIQDIIQEYITRETEKRGGVSPEAFNWNWSIGYFGDPSALPPFEGQVVAKRVDAPVDGRRYVIYHEAQGCTLTDHANSGGFDITEIGAYGDTLVDAIPENALIFTAHVVNDNELMLSDDRGQYLTCGASGGLSLMDKPASDDLSLWQLIPAEGGYHLKSAGARNDQALQYYGGRITTYFLNSSGLFLFNFYEVADEISPSVDDNNRHD